MADIYLSSVDGNDADDGSTWALAKATLSAAMSAAGAGGRVFVDHAHAESSASGITITSPGTAAAPISVLCVDRTGNPEPPTTLATTATVSTTGANNLGIVGDSAYIYGIKFTAGSGGSNGSLLFASSGSSPRKNWVVLDNCALKLGNTNTAARIQLGTTTNGKGPATVELRDTTLEFGHVSQQVQFYGNVIWRGGSLINATIPTTLVSLGVSYNNSQGRAILSGVDLSAAGSGKSLFGVGNATNYRATLMDCKLGASVSLTSGTHVISEGVEVEAINCDSGDTNYRYDRSVYEGAVAQETTIVLTGGASDGATNAARKLVSSANVTLRTPLRQPILQIWNESTGASLTVTVEVVTDGVTLTDAEAWLEVEYLGTSGSTLGARANDRVASSLATPANQTSSSATWTTTGLSSPVTQKLEVAITPQKKGLIRAWVCLAKASTTMYAQPSASPVA